MSASRQKSRPAALEPALELEENMTDTKVDDAEVARARKLIQMRGTGDNLHRKIAIERKIKALPPHILAATKADKPAAAHVTKPAAKAKASAPAKKTALPDDYAALHPELSLGEFHFGLLPKAFTTTMPNGDEVPGPIGYASNLNAKALLEKVKKASEAGVPLFKELDFLHFQQEHELPRVLDQLADDHGTIAQKARRDKELATDAKAHAVAQDMLRKAGKDVEAAYDAALSAAAGLKVAMEQKELRADEKAQQQAEANLRDVEEKAKQAKELIKEGLGQIKELVEKGPIDYVVGKATEVGEYLKDKAIDFLVDDYYAPQRKAAEEALAAAKKAVEDVKSNIELGRIERWTEDLKSKKAAYEGSLLGLLAAATEAQSAETNLIEESEKMGLDSAARAVESRQEMVRSSKKAKSLVGPQLSACARIEKDAVTLANEYKDYAESFARLMKYDIDPPVSKEEKVRAEIHGIAVANISVAKAVQANAAEETRRCKEEEKFLDAAGYVGQYEQIEKGLAKAVNDR